MKRNGRKVEEGMTPGADAIRAIPRKKITGCRRARLLVLPAALGGLLLLACGCGRKPDGAKAAEEQSTANLLVKVADVVRAETRTLESGVSFTGELNPQQVTEITAHFDGDLQEVRVREGQRVARGQSLAVYKPVDMKDAWDAADAQLQAAQANLTAARNGEARARKLLDAGAAAPSDLEAATAARAAAEAQVRAAQAAANHAQENADRLVVPSPIRGQVSQVMVHNGDRTAVNDRLMTIVNTDTLELSATIPSEALGRIRLGTPLQFQLDAFPGQTFTGKVDRINPTTEPGTRQVRIYTRIPNSDGRLVGGLFLSGRVIDSVKENALVAPATALRLEGGEQVVYRLRGGMANRVAVKTGLQDEQSGLVELIGGLAAGDSLLTGVLPGIRDGMSVRLLKNGADASTRH